jgi:hypothetical protein
LQYCIVDGDHSDFDNIKINCCKEFNEPCKEKALAQLLGINDTIILSSDKSLIEQKNWDKIAVINHL